MMCISLFSYGMTVVVRCMGIRLGMGWVGSVIWWVGLGWVDENRPTDNSEAGPKIFAPTQTNFPGARDGQNLMSLRWSLYLYLQTQFGEDRCTQFLVIVVTDPTRTQTTHTGPITIHCAAASLARSVITELWA